MNVRDYRSSEDLRHLARPGGIRPGWTVELTAAKSFEIEPKTATAEGVIALDGLVVRLDGPREEFPVVRIFWLADAMRIGGTHQVVPVDYTLSLADLNGLAGHPPTMWNPVNSATLRISAAQRNALHLKQRQAAASWWCDVRDIDEGER